MMRQRSGILTSGSMAARSAAGSALAIAWIDVIP
jgi:hypothetical protein